MPNWSYNNLTISGSEADMEKFLSEAIKPNINGEDAFCFANIFPMPQKLKNTISPSSSAKGRKWMNADRADLRENSINELLGEETKNVLIPVENNTDEKCLALRKEFGTDNWYDWNVQNWGTKWDVEVLKSNCWLDETSINMSFNTAWSPPETFLKKLQQKYQSLDIKLSYTLEGSDTCGLFETYRDGDFVDLDYSEDEVIYRASDGRDIYFDESCGEWKYNEDEEICEDYIWVSPFE